MEGLHKLWAFAGLFGAIYVFAVVVPLFRPDLLEGAPWDVLLAGYLMAASPLLLGLVSFNTLWKTRVLQARPVQTGDDGLIFPTTWRGREPRIDWGDIKAVGTDYDSREARRRMYWHLWIALRDGRVLERPYLAGDDGSAVIRTTVSQLRQRVSVVGGADVLRAAGRRPVRRFAIGVARTWAVLSAPVVLLVVLTFAFIGLVPAYPLSLGGVLTAVLVFAIPSWMWASHMQDLSRSTGPVGG